MVGVNGIAHIQLTVRDPERCLPFWERLCNFLDMRTLIRGEDVLYCIGSRTGILVRAAPADKRDRGFDQDRPGLHHFCFRARSREDVDAIYSLEPRLPTLPAVFLAYTTPSEHLVRDEQPLCLA